MVSWLRDVKTQVCACDCHINFSLHGAPLPSYGYIREQAKIQDPEVGYHEIAIKYRDTVIMKVHSRVFQTGTPCSSQGIPEEQQVASAMSKDEVFTPIEREYLITRLEKEHSHSTPEEIEEGMEKYKEKFYPCAEHMKRAAMKVSVFSSLFVIPFTIQMEDPSVDGEAGDDEEEEEEGNESGENESKAMVIESEDEEIPHLCNFCGAEGHSVDSELSEFTIKEQTQVDEKTTKDSDSKNNKEEEKPSEEKKLDGVDIPFNKHLCLVIKQFVLRESDEEQEKQRVREEKQKFNLD